MEPGVPGDLVAANQRQMQKEADPAFPSLVAANQKAALLARLDRDFTYHPPINDQTQRYQAIRARAKELAVLIVESSPASREQSLALTHVEEASMWANAAIARNEK